MAEYCRDACAETGGVEQDERLDPYAKVWSAKPVLSQTSTSFLTRSQSETISMPGSYLALIGSTVLHTSPMSLPSPPLTVIQIAYLMVLCEHAADTEKFESKTNVSVT